MALERLTLAPASLDGDTNGAQAGDDGGRAPRLPRWTRQEILVLIQGKRVAENRARRGRTAGFAFGSGQVESKWASVSSYCKRHGVNRGPVQCRKRWSNLAGDYKKIKEWESRIKEETESFWVMRNDLRRERKLPGLFDREVYDILDGVGTSAAAAVDIGSTALVLDLASAATEDEAETEAEATEAEAVFDSGRSAAADDGLFSDFEQSGPEEVMGRPEKRRETPATTTVVAPIPISEKQYEPVSRDCPPDPAAQGRTRNEKQETPTPDEAREGRKRKRFETGGGVDKEEISLQNQLIEAMERSGRLLSSQLEAQNTNFQLDREQRRDHSSSLIAVLNKLADAMVRIADKL